MSNLPFSFKIDDQNPRHTRLTVFNRGANAGTLTILTDDFDEFQERLIGGEWLRGGAVAEYEVEDDEAID